MVLMPPPPHAPLTLRRFCWFAVRTVPPALLPRATFGATDEPLIPNRLAWPPKRLSRGESY